MLVKDQASKAGRAQQKHRWIAHLPYESLNAALEYLLLLGHSYRPSKYAAVKCCFTSWHATWKDSCRVCHRPCREDCTRWQQAQTSGNDGRTCLLNVGDGELQILRERYDQCTGSTRANASYCCSTNTIHHAHAPSTSLQLRRCSFRLLHRRMQQKYALAKGRQVRNWLHREL